MSEDNQVFEYSVSLENAEAPAVLPKGDYAAEIRKATRKTSATSGNEYISLDFYISPEQYPVDFTDGSPDGTTLAYNRLTFKDDVQGRYRMKKALQALGAKLSNKVDPNDLMGLTCTVTVDHATFEGEPKAEITKIKSK